MALTAVPVGFVAGLFGIGGGLITVPFLYYIFGRCFVNDFGSEGIVMAHFLRYVIYLVIVFYILRHQFIGKDKAI